MGADIIEFFGTVEQAILRLFHDIDSNDGAAVSRAFAEDGIWVRRSVPRIGRQAVADDMASRPAGRRVQHLISNILLLQSCASDIEVEFKALAYADTNPRDDQASPLFNPIALDVYRAKLRRLDGQWQFTYLKAERLFAS